MELVKRVLSIMLLLLFIPLVSAEISLGQPKSLYNIGDNFNIDVTLKPGKQVDSFLILKLMCESQNNLIYNSEGNFTSSKSVEIYRNSFSILAEEEEVVDITAKLSNSLLNGMLGNCFINSVFGAESANSQNFEISRGIFIGLDVSGVVFDPAGGVVISGSARKRNGDLVNGFLEMKIEDIGVVKKENVIDGEFDINFSLPENAESGKHIAEAYIYERDVNGEISNEGSEYVNIEISSIWTKLEIAVESQTVAPGKSASYRLLLYDQTGNEIEGDVSVIIYKPDDSIYYKKLVRTGKTENIEFELADSPGYWEIEAEGGSLSATKLLFLENIEQAEFSLINDTLIVYNVGNVPYTKPLEVSVGSVVEIIPLNLGIGGTKKLRLTAPNGEYSIKVNDGSVVEILGNSYLTGRVVGVKEIGNEANFNVSTILWIFVIGFMSIFAWILYKKKPKKSFVAKESGSKKNNQKSKSGLIHKGGKHDASVIALKLEQESEKSGELVSKILSKTKESGARIFNDGKFHTVIFQGENGHIKAVKTAQEIHKLLKDQNDKKTKKQAYGIGVHTGELISEVHDGKFKYVSVGNTISTAKRISSFLYEGVLLSDEARKKNIGAVRTEKMPNIDAWKVREVSNRGMYSGVLKGFEEIREN